MRADFFYNGKAYGSVESDERPRVGAFYRDKMIIEVTDMRKVWDPTYQPDVVQADFWCELRDP